jgi:hypothetical protein
MPARRKAWNGCPRRSHYPILSLGRRL